MSALHSRASLPDLAVDPPGPPEPARAGPPGVARGTRVLLLAAAVLAMSVVDLYITLLYLDSVGLAESNPLARMMMEQGSPGLLAAWKLVTVLPTVLVLVFFRRRLSAEVLAWAGCAVLVGVMLRWGEYAAQTDLLLISLPALEEGIDHRWVGKRD